jgi:integrase/recombinase XerD
MIGPEFSSYLLAQGYARNTCRAYVSRLLMLEDYCRGRGFDLATIEAPDLATYCEELVPLKTSTRRHLRTGLKRYWEFVGRFDGPALAVRVPPKPRYVCKAVSEHDAQLLAKVARHWYPEGLAVVFGLYMALRRAEIARARWDGFDTEGEWYSVTGKRDVTAELPVHPILSAELAEAPQRSAWIFPSPYDSERPVTPTTVWVWTRRVAAAAGIARIGTHQLRHTALATMNDATGDLRATQEFARHRSPETTASYTRTTAARLQKVLGSLDYEGDGNL